MKQARFAARVLALFAPALMSTSLIGASAQAEPLDLNLDSINFLKGQAGLGIGDRTNGAYGFGIEFRSRGGLVLPTGKASAELGGVGTGTLVGGAAVKIGGASSSSPETTAFGHFALRSTPTTTRFDAMGGVDIPLGEDTKLVVGANMPMAGGYYHNRTSGVGSVGLGGLRAGIEKHWGEAMELAAYVDAVLTYPFRNGEEGAKLGHFNQPYQVGVGGVGSASVDFKYYPTGHNCFLGVNGAVTGRASKTGTITEDQVKHVRAENTADAQLMMTGGVLF